MREGLCDQFEKLADRKDLVIETLGESGRWFKATYATTPPTATVCHSDFEKNQKASAWYNSRVYRANLYADREGLRLRDLVLFDNGYTERYLDAAEPSPVLQFDTLFAIDGNRFSGNGIRAGGYLLVDGERVQLERMIYRDKNGDMVLFLETDRGELIATFSQAALSFSLPSGESRRLSVEIVYDKTKTEVYQGVDERGILLSQRGYLFRLNTKNACTFGMDSVLISGDSDVTFDFS